MSDAEEPTATAIAPFDNPDGDIILRSTTDRVDFHTFKFILSLMSPVIKDMFTLPQNGLKSGESSVPIIPVAESSATLESLLIFYYPAATPKAFSSFSHAVAVMKAAKKYDMQVVLNRTVDLIIAQFLPDRVLELYALFCQLGWQDYAQIAATQALEIKDLGRPSHVFNGMRNITAFDYHRLLAYHQECGVAAQDVGKSPFSGNHIFELVCDTCACFTKNLSWFNEYLDKSGKELLMRPCESTLWESASYIHATIKAFGDTSCYDCKYKLVEGIGAFRALYIARVKEAVAKVKLADADQ
ncbi:hypothetical protein DFJ58DRAFT_725931 [Suillus subalutaceus]|uniref:uncharacterized protein n=1 Tax=Suillus subalutaceus TaxID=48586 RepID=UPI001B87A2FA|nr:uncharacterized protein DFJ58DRAFT_725931 [Suillus subalutaceus]KAG1860633.1 hypothetical protein DFJ58DRAFT_725931 [Suillus subalutaceus]